MNTKINMVVALLGLVLAAGCGAGDSPELSRICDGGELLDIADGRACLYNQPITETRFRCPPELPHLHEFEEGFFVCASEELSGMELEGGLVDRGYLDPPRRDPPEMDPPEMDPPVEEPPVEEPPVEEPPVEEPCAEGEQVRCTCPNGSHGAQTCAEGELSDCACRDDWEAPGVNEVQDAPVNCPEPSIITTHPADLDNTEVAPGVCLEEVLEAGCPIMRTRRTFTGDVQDSEELEIVNQAAFEETIHHWYYDVQPYRNTWIINDAGLPELLEQDALVDGVIDATTTYRYDAAGRLVYEEIDHETHGYNSVREWTYDDDGRLVRQESVSRGEDYENHSVTTSTWTEEGEPLETRTTYNGELRARDEWTYDDEGRPTRHEVASFDGRFTETNFHYREDGTREREWIREFSSASDENGDSVRYLSEVRERFFDEQEREILQTSDSLGNGLAIIEFTWSYDDEGRVVYESYGRQDEPEPRWYREFVYGEGGQLERSESWEVNPGRDHITTVLYDEHGQEVESRTVEQYTDEVLEQYRKIWDGPGRLIMYERDTNGDGVWDSRTTSAYDAAGQQVDAQFDYNADGFIEERTAYRYDCSAR